MEHIKQEEHQSYVSNHMESICKSDALSAFAWWKTDQSTTTMLRLYGSRHCETWLFMNAYRRVYRLLLGLQLHLLDQS